MEGSRNECNCHVGCLKKGAVDETRIFVKMKMVKKAKTHEHFIDDISDEERRMNEAADNQTALLEIPSRRRLSDDLDASKPTNRARRRSVSFDPLTVLKTAILENDVDTLKGVLMTGKVSVDSSLDGILPVILAAKEGCAECLEMIIEKGASIDVQDKRGFSPLELAVQGGHYECAQILIASGANDNSIRNGYFDESIERHMSSNRRRSRTF